MAPERSEGTTKGLRVINSVDPCVLFLDYRLVIVPLQLPVKSRQLENVAAVKILVTSPGNSNFI